MSTNALSAAASQRVEVDRGAAIEVRFFAPPADRSPRAAVLIGGAMGVRQNYYRPFAEWLATQRIAPADVAAPRIGHFGFFRDAFAATLWIRAAAWLREFQPAQETI